MKYWDRAWSLVDGCTPCSPGCDHCWSAAMTRRFNPEFTTGSMVFNGIIRVRPDRLDVPLRRKKPTVYCIWNDLFHEDVPEGFICRAYAVMAACPQHTFMVLTKRSKRMSEWFDSRYFPGKIQDARIQAGSGPLWGKEDAPAWPPPNVWNGLTVCNQGEADAKIPVFLQVPGKKFLSIEPMLGAVDIERYLWLVSPSTAGPWRDYTGKIVWYGGGIGGQMISSNPSRYINAVIVGGETGPHARPMHPDWARRVRDDCAAAGVPFLFKQWGEWIPKSQVIAHGPNCQWGTLTIEGDWFPQTTPWNGHDDDGSGEAVMYSTRGSGTCRLLDGREHNDMPWRAS